MECDNFKLNKKKDLPIIKKQISSSPKRASIKNSIPNITKINTKENIHSSPSISKCINFCLHSNKHVPV